MEEKFCLKWNDFQENTIKTFSNLRQEDAFFDVTLVSDDQRQMMAHKVVLSACSEYFKDILKSNKHSHSLICLTGITSIELENVLDYIYHGEVQMFQEKIDIFLDVALRLKLKGLLATEETANQQYDKNVVIRKLNKPDERDKPQISEAQYIQTFQDESAYSTSAISIPIDSSSSIDEIEQKVLEYLEKNENGDYMCKICGKVGGKRINTKRHIETHLDGISVFCSICGNSLGQEIH